MTTQLKQETGHLRKWDELSQRNNGLKIQLDHEHYWNVDVNYMKIVLLILNKLNFRTKRHISPLHINELQIR